jgi:hypothetical protein
VGAGEERSVALYVVNLFVEFFHALLAATALAQLLKLLIHILQLALFLVLFVYQKQNKRNCNNNHRISTQIFRKAYTCRGCFLC